MFHFKATCFEMEKLGYWTQYFKLKVLKYCEIITKLISETFTATYLQLVRFNPLKVKRQKCIYIF